MPEFYSAYNRPKTISANPKIYDKLQVLYREEVIDGEVCLVEDGVRDIYEAIQTHADDGDLVLTIQRLSMGYDVELNPEGAYTDFSDAPLTLADAQNKIIQVKDEFSKLPPEVRQKFGNSAESYIALYGSPEWARSLGLISEETKSPVKEGEPVEQKQ